MTTKRQGCHYDNVSVDKIEEKQSSGKFWAGTIFGFVIGFVCMIAISNTEMVFYNKAQQIKSQCEAELPRNKQCKIVINAEIDQ